MDILKQDNIFHVYAIVHTNCTHRLSLCDICITCNLKCLSIEKYNKYTHNAHRYVEIDK